MALSRLTTIGKLELVGAKPLHLLTQTALPLESPTGAFIAAQPQPFRNYFFTGKNKAGQPAGCPACFSFHRFYSSVSSLSKNAMPNAPGPVWVPMTQPIWRTSGSPMCRFSRK